MEWNSMLFPAPSRPIDMEKIGQNLIWVPVYKQGEGAVKSPLATKLRTYFDSKGSSENKKIATSIRMRSTSKAESSRQNSCQDNSEVHKFLDTSECISPGEDFKTNPTVMMTTQKPKQRPISFITGSPATVGKPRIIHLRTQRNKAQNPSLCLTSGPLAPKQGLQDKRSYIRTLLLSKGNQDVTAVSGIKKPVIVSCTENVDDLLQKASAQCTLPPQQVLTNSPILDLTKKRQTSVEIKKVRQELMGNVRICKKLCENSRIRTSCPNSQDVLKRQNNERVKKERNEDLEMLSKTDECVSSINMESYYYPKEGASKTSSNVFKSPKPFLQSRQSKNIEVIELGTTAESTEERLPTENYNNYRTIQTSVPLLSGLLRGVKHLNKQQTPQLISGESIGSSRFGETQTRNYRTLDLHTTASLNKSPTESNLVTHRDRPHSVANPLYSIPCLYFESPKLPFLSMQMSEYIIVYLHGNAEDLQDCSYMPEMISSRLNVSYFHCRLTLLLWSLLVTDCTSRGLLQKPRS